MAQAVHQASPVPFSWLFTFFQGMVLCRIVWECLMEAKSRLSRHPLPGRNDMKTSKRRFSRQKHAHKQRKQGLSCHHAPPLYIWTFHPLQPARSCPVPRMRHAQVRSGTIRCTPVLSETLYFNIGPTVHKRLKHHNSRNCHNRLKSHGHPPLFQRSSTAPTAQ